jgi:hypothetical protein
MLVVCYAPHIKQPIFGEFKFFENFVPISQNSFSHLLFLLPFFYTPFPSYVLFINVSLFLLISFKSSNEIFTYRI